MKNILVIIILISSVLSGYSQTDFSDKELNLIGIYHDSIVKLRWSVLTSKMWKQAKTYGFKLERVSETANTLDTVILAQGLKPLEEHVWDSLFTNNESADLAKNLLYNDQDQLSGSMGSMEEIFEYRQQEESKHLFVLIAAERDFDVACGLALAYGDDDPLNQGERYSYILSIDNDSLMQIIEPATFMLKIEETQSLPAVSEIKGMPDEEVLFIQWAEQDGYYTAYDIERSVDSLNWGKCNRAPFMNIITADQEAELATFRDSVPDVNIEYHYRVRGKTPFGVYGPYSDVITLKCSAPLLQLPLDFDGYVFDGEDVVLNWNSLPAVYSDSLLGFNIYRLTSLNGEEQKLNSSLIDPSAREFADVSNNLSDAYYYLEAIDLESNIYRSLEMIVRKEDHIAPSIPQGLSYEMLNYSKVFLTWELNEEEDFDGYYINISDTRNGSFVRLNDEKWRRNTFEYNITAATELDSIFFMITAVDKRGNVSDPTEVLAIERPDIFGPNAPVLNSVYAKPSGVFMAWNYSTSDDVVLHKVQRKKIDGYHPWKTILEIDNNEQSNYPSNQSSSGDSYNYVDSTELDLNNYAYQLVAQDDSGNETASGQMNIFPFKAAVDGVVTNFEIDIEGDIQRPNHRLNAELEKLRGKFKNIDQVKSLPNVAYKVKLNWKAVLDYELHHFQVYKSVGSGSITPYRMVTPEEGLGLSGDYTFTADSGPQDFKIEDDEVKNGVRYSYYIVAVYNDGSESKRSSTLSKKVPK